jgi:predicted HAD superfamily Cof-like phosphohydrolase
MSLNNYRDVGTFHKRFGLRAHEYGPGEMTDELLQFRLKFLKEELQEFEDASVIGDHAGMADALIDLVYVAMGTAHFFGYPWPELWDDVQSANMAKQRAQSSTESARGTAWDVIKPPGWVPPRTAEILAQYGFTP